MGHRRERRRQEFADHYSAWLRCTTSLVVVGVRGGGLGWRCGREGQRERKVRHRAKGMGWSSDRLCHMEATTCGRAQWRVRKGRGKRLVGTTRRAACVPALPACAGRTASCRQRRRKETVSEDAPIVGCMGDSHLFSVPCCLSPGPVGNGASDPARPRARLRRSPRESSRQPCTSLSGLSPKDWPPCCSGLSRRERPAAWLSSSRSSPSWPSRQDGGEKGRVQEG